MDEATAIREKEAAAFEKETAETRSYLDAMARAIAALEKGMINTRGSLEGAPPAAEQFMGKNEYGIETGKTHETMGAFLQSSAAAVLRRLTMSSQISSEDRA